MDIEKIEIYSLIDKGENIIGEISGIKQVENWYIGKIDKLNLPEALDQLFLQIDALLKKKDFSAVRKVEEEIEEYGLKLKEGDYSVTEFQFGKKKNQVYFKIVE